MKKIGLRRMICTLFCFLFLVSNPIASSAADSDITRLDVDQAWKYTTGKGVNAAILDGGANLNDPAIRKNIKGVYNAASGSTDWNDISADSHGTGCAKILISVAKDVNLYIIQVGENGYVYGEQVLKGLKWAKEQNCRVISMSFGSDTYSNADYNLIQELYTASSGSALVCASAGNSGKKEYHYPASYDNTLSVGAAQYHTAGKKYEVISNGTYNDKIDIAAPGSTTSAAAPFAAGTAALLFSAKPSLSARECKDIINKTALDLGNKGYDPYSGYGLIQPFEAVKKAGGYSVTPNHKTEAESYSLTLKKTKAVIKVGKSVKIKVKSIVPSNDKIKSYKSSNKKVASVNAKGKVTGKKKGKAQITVTTKKGSKAVFQVRVKK